MIDNVTITPRFRRSVRIDSDFATVAAIDGFHCPESFKAAITFMASHIADTEQGAFTWTGPYGGGKSSLALALACLFGAPKPVREQAAEVFGSSVAQSLKGALPHFPARWDVLPVVIERRSIGDQIQELLDLPSGSSTRDILDELEARTNGRGLLLILDELGRGLEAAADGEGDVHLLQDVAELAARSGGRLIVLGILHQSFEEYARELSRSSRDNWAKIQGRFVDISISVSLEETIELIGEALGHQRAVRKALPLAENCVSLLRPARNKGDAKRLTGKLARTAPLHPVTTCLVGPMSRRRFCQNQRSVFSFLSSAEPHGLQDILAENSEDEYYPPYRLWDYLQANLEAAILSSNDSRRWATGHEAIERCIARGADETEQLALKTIAVIELLRDRSNLVADLETIACALQTIPFSEVEAALKRLEQQSEIVFRKHSNAYMLYAGSDFDVDLSLAELLSSEPAFDINLVRSLAELQPILAKRHYDKTGSMRWFDVSIEPLGELRNLGDHRLKRDEIGRVIYALPTEGESSDELAKACEAASSLDLQFPVLVGFHPSVQLLIDLARELAALDRLHHKFPELRGDPVARREIDSRKSEIRFMLEDQLSGLTDDCVWYEKSVPPRKLSKPQLNERLSIVADELFHDAPCLNNELLNCSEPSSNAVSARTKLMKRMALRGHEIDLGFEGKNYPAERGLFISLLVEMGIHAGGEFAPPEPDHTLFPLWREADQILAEADQGTVTAKDIIDKWALAPIGLKEGLGQVFIAAYLLSRRDKVAVYGEGAFQSKFNELCVEYLARDPSDIGLRKVEMDGFIGDTLAALGELLDLKNASEPLYVAREIIGDFDGLVPWTTRTQSLSPLTLQVREILKRASDPNKLLFDDLPGLTEPASDGSFDPNATALLLRDALAEMRASYPNALDELKELMLRELDVRSETKQSLQILRDRADNIRELGGDLRLEAFISRLAQFHATREDMEGLASVAVNKLPRDWNDGDRASASVALAELATAFLKMETLARVKGRKDKRHALAVVIGKEDMPRSLFQEFEVSDVDLHDVQQLTANLDKALEQAGQQNRDIILAALIEVTSKYLRAAPQRIEERA